MASATDAEKTLRSTDGKENFQRLTRLLMCGGVRLLRETFDYFHSPTDLPSKLVDPAIKSQLRGAKLSRAEWDRLYPSPGTFGKSADFDITLTFRLLRTICGLTTPVTGWDSFPSSADHSLEADLARIKYYRNSVYGHNQRMEILNSEFCNIWKEISEALLRIAGNLSPAKKDEWKKSIDRLLNDPLTPEAQGYVEELKLWYKKDMDVKSAVEHLKDQLQQYNIDVINQIQQVRGHTQQVNIDVEDQLQQVNEKLDSVLIFIGLESFSQREQPITHVRSCSRSGRMDSLFIHQEQPQSGTAEGASGEHLQVNCQNPPEEPDIWSVICSFKESFKLLFEYLSKQLKVRISSYGLGSLFITVTCSSLEILEGLWEDYCSGHLNTVAEEILITAQVLEKLSFSEVKLKTMIKEEDYKKCKEFFVGTDQGRDLRNERHIEQQGARYPGQSLETGQDLNVPQQALEAKPHTVLNTLVQESEKRTGNWEMESAWIQLQLTNCRDELRHKEAETAIFKGQLVEKDEQIKTLLKLNSTMQQQLVSLKAELKEKTKETAIDQETDNLGQQLMLKEEQQPIARKPPTRETKQVANIQRQLREMEQQQTEKEEREENLQTQLKEMEQRLTEKETRETGLCEQVRERDQQVASIQRQLREMEQQLTENGTRETGLREQLRERDQREANIQRQLREMEQQLMEKEERKENLQTQLREMAQRLTEKDTRETGLREQLIESDQREANIQRLLREMEQQLTEKEEREENLQTQLREMAQRLTEKETRETGLLEQLRERDQKVANIERQLGVWGQREVENDTLRQQVAYLESRVGSESHDWVIPRDEIQMTDKSLGVGGWAEVFEGRYCGCAVAVKRMHEAIISPHNQGLFQREIDIASRCRHPCLLQFIGATNDEEMPLFVTELMESNLRQLLEERQRQQRRLSKTEITVISLDVAQALNYLHQKKPNPIIHRDVSSSNVLLWRQGDRWRGKVSDYGTAKFEEQFMSIVPGSFAYSAPEVQRPSDQTAKIDVYSFGVLLCEMCIGEFPDPQKREQQLAKMTDHLLQGLVRRCLQSDPRERPDMDEIINELEQFNKTS